MNICVIRHGETDWNALGKVQGREDIPLNRNGKEQAERCGLALKGGSWKAVVTSPLQRARQTAGIIADTLGIRESVADDDLTERDYGKASGLTPKERAVLFPDGIYEGIEARESLRDRVCGAVLRNAEKYFPEDIIIVSHGGAINAILAELSGHTIGSGKTALRNACVNMLTYDGQKLGIVFYNKAAEGI